ncbi:MAG: VIT and VWA domain-containing protein [bacterium]
MKKKVIKVTGIVIIAIALAAGVCLSAGKNKTAATKGNRGWVEAADKTAGATAGAIGALDANGETVGNCPLKHTDVAVSVAGFIARVNVTQQFVNPFKEKIEAVYTFPMSQNGAVDRMEMRIGDRTIKGLIKRREEARRIYDEAKAAGHAAGLLDQERPNIFTQYVANIMPGENITIKISYVEYLDYEDGWYAFSFPMVVGPRYIPGADATGWKGTGWSPDTDRTPDASLITPPVTPEGTRAGHDISLAVNIDAGLPIKEIKSKLHDVVINRKGAGSARIELKDKNTIPNKDFILRYRVAGAEIEDAVLTHAAKGKKGFFTLIVQPPLRTPAKKISPKELIFVIDSSGSMSGWPIEKAKETMKYCIEKMNPDDTFQLIAFSNKPRPLFDRPQLNTAANREKALRFLGGSLGGGGTEMLKAVHMVLKRAPDPKRVRIVAFMTDGYVGNDMDILDNVKRYVGNARFFSFGVGNGVNRFLLDEMARIGRGEVEYVELNASGADAAKKFHERIANPILTDIKINWGGLHVSDVFPEAIPDLYSNRPLIVKGRYSGSGKETVTISGRAAGKRFVKKLKVDFPKVEAAHETLGPLWARERIAEVMRKDYGGIQNGNPRPEVKELIVELGLEFKLVTQYTSFVAVDEMVIREGGKTRTVPVPVEMPEGVSYQGVFGDSESSPAYSISAFSMAAPSPASTGYAYVGGGGGFPAKLQKQQSSGYAAVLEGKVEYDVSAGGAVGGKDYYGTADESNKKEESRLAPELRGFAKMVAEKGKNGNLKIKGIEVKNWTVTVTVLMKELTKENLEALKKLGFIKLGESAAAKAAVGTIDVRKLEQLAKLGFVMYVEPVK